MTEHVVNGLRAMLVGLIFEQIELAEQEGHESGQYADTIVAHNVVILQTFGKKLRYVRRWTAASLLGRSPPLRRQKR